MHHARAVIQSLAVSLNCRHRACMRAYSVDLRRKIVEAAQRGMAKAQAAALAGSESLQSNDM